MKGSDRTKEEMDGLVISAVAKPSEVRLTLCYLFGDQAPQVTLSITTELGLKSLHYPEAAFTHCSLHRH